MPRRSRRSQDASPTASGKASPSPKHAPQLAAAADAGLSLAGETANLTPRKAPEAKERVLPPASSLPGKDTTEHDSDGEAPAGEGSPSPKAGGRASSPKSTGSGSPKAGGRASSPKSTGSGSPKAGGRASSPKSTGSGSPKAGGRVVVADRHEVASVSTGQGDSDIEEGVMEGGGKTGEGGSEGKAASPRSVSTHSSASSHGLGGKAAEGASVSGRDRPSSPHSARSGSVQDEDEVESVASAGSHGASALRAASATHIQSAWRGHWARQQYDERVAAADTAAAQAEEEAQAKAAAQTAAEEEAKVEEGDGYSSAGDSGFESEGGEEEVGSGGISSASAPYPMPIVVTRYRHSSRSSVRLVDTAAQTEEDSSDEDATFLILPARPYVQVGTYASSTAGLRQAGAEEAAAAAASVEAAVAALQGGRSSGAWSPDAHLPSAGAGHTGGEEEEEEGAGNPYGGEEEGKEGGDAPPAHMHPVDGDVTPGGGEARVSTKGARLADVLTRYKKGLATVFTHYARSAVGKAGERGVGRRTFDNMAAAGGSLKLSGWLRFVREFGLMPALMSKEEATQLWQDTVVLSQSGGIQTHQFGHAFAAIAVNLLTLPEELIAAFRQSHPVSRKAAGRSEVPFFSIALLRMAEEAAPSGAQADALEAVDAARRQIAELNSNGDRAAFLFRFFELHKVKDVHRRNRRIAMSGANVERNSYLSPQQRKAARGGKAFEGNAHSVLPGTPGEADADWSFYARGRQLARLVSDEDIRVERAERVAARSAATPQIVRGADLAALVNAEIEGSTGDELLIELHHKRREQARLSNLDRREHRRRHQKPLEGVRVKPSVPLGGTPSPARSGKLPALERSPSKTTPSPARRPSGQLAPMEASHDAASVGSHQPQAGNKASVAPLHRDGSAFRVGQAPAPSPAQYAPAPAHGSYGGYASQPTGQQGAYGYTAPQAGGYGHAQPSQGYAPPSQGGYSPAGQRVAAETHARAAAVAQQQAVAQAQQMAYLQQQQVAQQRAQAGYAHTGGYAQAGYGAQQGGYAQQPAQGGYSAYAAPGYRR